MCTIQIDVYFTLLVTGLSGICGSDEVSSARLNGVIDAYEHALLELCPRARYVVGNEARFLWLPIQALPEWLGDWILASLNKNRPIPAAVKKHQ